MFSGDRLAFVSGRTAAPLGLSTNRKRPTTEGASAYRRAFQCHWLTCYRKFHLGRFSSQNRNLPTNCPVPAGARHYGISAGSEIPPAIKLMKIKLHTVLLSSLLTSCGTDAGSNLPENSGAPMTGSANPMQPVPMQPVPMQPVPVPMQPMPMQPMPMQPVDPAPIAPPATPAPVATGPTPPAPPTMQGPDDAPIPEANSPLASLVRALSGHINGNTVSDALLTAIHDTLKGSDNEFGGDVGAMALAIDVIKAYDEKYGPLFTPQGTLSFPSRTDDVDTALERAMHQIYLGVFDAIDAELLERYPKLVGGLAYDSASYFPGAVPVAEDPTAIYTRTINASVPRDFGRANQYSERDAVRPTGAYLAPGTIGEVIVPDVLVGKGLRVQVGAHTWDLSEKPTSKRLARVVKTYAIESTVTRIANPVGGNIYILLPHLTDEGLVDVQFRNTGRSPLYSKLPYSQTSPEDWLAERLHPGAWADFETERVMMNVPAKWVRDFDTPEQVMATYDGAMDAVSEFMGKPPVRNKPHLYLQVDVLLRGTAFFPGYPMSNFPTFDRDERSSPLTEDFVHNTTLWHEHGHASFITKFADSREADVHLLNVYIENTRYDKPLERAFVTSNRNNDETVTMEDVFATWVITDGFIDGDDMFVWDTNYQLRGYAHYIDMVDMFGWKSMVDFNTKLNEDAEGGINVSRNSHDDDDRIYRFSVAAGADLRPLYHMWGRSPNNQADLQTKLDEAGLRPSAAVYDKLMAYRESVPRTQEQFDAFYSTRKALTNQVRRAEFWDGLSDNYPASRVQAILGRIDQLIGLYFPNGRP